jgi:pyridoxamine 5'-phosphate oxidase family protein
MTFTDVQLEYLDSQRLGRLATVSGEGDLQNNPVGFFYNADLGTVDIGGSNMGSTRKFRNVQATGRAAFVVDDLASVQPWRVRGVEIRGRAEALADVEPPGKGYSGELIRIHPDRIIAWGLEGNESP